MPPKRPAAKTAARKAARPRNAKGRVASSKATVATKKKAPAKKCKTTTTKTKKPPVKKSPTKSPKQTKTTTRRVASKQAKATAKKAARPPTRPAKRKAGKKAPPKRAAPVKKRPVGRGAKSTAITSPSPSASLSSADSVTSDGNTSSSDSVPSSNEETSRTRDTARRLELDASAPLSAVASASSRLRDPMKGSAVLSANMSQRVPSSNDTESDLSTSDDDAEEEEEEEEEESEEEIVSDSDSDDSCPARVTVDPSEINDNPLASLLSPHPSDSIIEMIRCLDRYTRTRVERRLAFFYDPYEDSLSSSPTGKKPKKVAATVAVRGLQQELARVKELLATSDVRANALLTMAHSFSYRYQTVWMRHQKKIKALEAKIIDAPTAKQLDMRAAAALERCGFVSGLYEDAPAIIFEREDTPTDSTSHPKPQADEKAGKSRSGKQQPGRGRNAASVQNDTEEGSDPSMAVFDLCPKAQLTKRVKRARTPAIPAPEGSKKGRKLKSVPRVRGDFITPDFTFLNPDGGELSGTALQVLYEVAKLEPRVDILALCFNTDRRTIQRHLHGEYQRQRSDSESEEANALSKEKKERRVRIEALLRSGAEVEGWGPAVDVGRCKEHLRLNGISISERRVERELRRIGLLGGADD